jgi:Protein of unknown function (DUF2555)
VARLQIRRSAKLRGVAMETLNISRQDVTHLTEKDVTALAARLEQDDYSSPFEGLNDWHLLRAIAFQRPELVEPYLYLLDLEAYDEA